MALPPVLLRANKIEQQNREANAFYDNIGRGNFLWASTTNQEFSRAVVEAIRKMGDFDLLPP